MLIQTKDNPLIIGEKQTANGSKPVLLSDAVSKAVRMYYLNNNKTNIKDLYKKVADTAEKSLIDVTMETFRGNQTKAASALGINRGTLRKKINKYEKNKTEI